MTSASNKNRPKVGNRLLVLPYGSSCVVSGSLKAGIRADLGLVVHAVRVVVCQPGARVASQILGAVREPIAFPAQ
jgi:hypothetical protein